MKLKNVLIVVKDIEKSKKFYNDVKENDKEEAKKEDICKLKVI